jgi:hypothetical protein
MQQEMLQQNRLSRSLYQRLEEIQERGDAGKTQALTQELLERGATALAGETAQQAAEDLTKLREGIEQAAESVLGSETEALRQADANLKAATEALQQEIAQEMGEQPGQAQNQPQQPQNQPGQPTPGQGQNEQEQAQNQSNRSDTAPGGNARPEFTNSESRRGGPAEIQEQAPTRREGRRVAQPLTGEDFRRWSDNLREAEEMISDETLRQSIAQSREAARTMRRDLKQDLKKPDWAQVQLQIVKPLLEVRNRLQDDLARRQSEKAAVALDQDPVPAEFSENVRQYFEKLGKESRK